MNIKRQVGINVRAVRERYGWSQEKLAEVAGLHRTYVSGVERGIRNPTVTILFQLARALKISPADLLRDGKSNEQNVKKDKAK